MTYTLLDVADGLAYRVNEQLDPDPDRSADLHRALRAEGAETTRVLELWASGYTLREISGQLWGVNSPNRAQGAIREGLRKVRGRMNGSLPEGSGEQISKCA